MNRFSLPFLQLILLFQIGNFYQAHAADSYQMNDGVTLEITEHATCRKITNNSGKSIFVPTKTIAEWLSFRTGSTPATVTRAACGVCGPANCTACVDVTTCTAQGCTWSAGSCGAEEI